METLATVTTMNGRISRPRGAVPTLRRFPLNTAARRGSKLNESKKRRHTHLPQRRAQYHESDLDFVLRLMREEGLFCWWEHAGDATRASLGTHTLVIADHNGAFATNLQPAVRFTASDHTMGEDSLERWNSIARVSSARVAMRSRDHRGLGAGTVEARVGSARPMSEPMSELAVVDVPGAYAFEDIAQGQRLASRQAEALAATSARAVAARAGRHLVHAAGSPAPRRHRSGARHFCRAGRAAPRSQHLRGR